jgi:hypothetical protein
MKQIFEISTDPLDVIGSPFMASLDVDTRKAIMSGISR